MTSFTLKVIACFTMFLDHLSYGLFGKMSWLNVIGRIAFPIFAFQITEGYLHTSNLKKYFSRLFLFAIISQIPFGLFHSIFSNTITLNIFFTLLFGLFCITIWDKLPSKLVNICIVFITCMLAEAINVDYGYWGVLLVFVFYLCHGHKIVTAFSFIVLILLKYLPNIIKYSFYSNIFLLLGTLLAIVPILLYNGKQGKKTKYFLYIFYPVHLLLLYGLHFFLYQ